MIDPVTGSMKSAGAPGMVDVTGGGASSLGSLAPSAKGGGSDPYSIFNSQLANMLVTAQQQNSQNNTLLGGAKDTLTTESVNPAGVQPANPGIFAQDQVANQQNLQKGFQPIVSSINTQLTNSQNNMAQLENTITGLQTAEQPIVLQPGQSLVARDGTVLQAGHSYTVQINPKTGLQDGFDQNTGTWASEDTAGGVTTSPPTSAASLVGGIDFSGNATSTKPYAVDPNYSSEVDSMYNQILKVSPVPSATGLDSFINSQVGGKGNVTGQMIMNAASTYKVDPNILAAVLAHESDFGTAGAGAKTFNPGNVGNTGTSTQTFSSWQQGVNAAAQALAVRMPGNPNASAPAKSSSSGTYLDDLAKKVANNQQGFADALGALPSAQQSAALLSKILAINPQFSITASNQNASAMGSALTQQATQVRPMVNHQNTAIEHLSNLGNLLTKINYSNIPIVNGIRDWFSDTISKDPNIAEAQSEIGVVRGEIAYVLAGGGAPTDADNREAAAVIPNDVSPSTFKQISTNVQTLMKNKIEQATNLNNIQQFTNGAAGANAGSTSSLSLTPQPITGPKPGTATNGSTYNYQGTTYVYNNGTWNKQ